MVTNKKSADEQISAIKKSLTQCKQINQAFAQTIESLEKQLIELERQIADDRGNVSAAERASHDEFLERKFESELQTARIKKFSAETAEVNNVPPQTTNIIRKKENPAAPKGSLLANLQRNSNAKSRSGGDNFLQDYNKLLSETGGYQNKVARENFVSNYNVRAFSCINYNERTNKPSLKAIFEESTSIQGGDYWAIPVSGNIFKVVPNIRNYNENYHVARAMGEVFDSNFVGGNYATIQLEKAAEFTNSGQSWSLVAKGKLVLR